MGSSEHWSTGLSWIHKGLNGNTSYKYQVKARNGNLTDTVLSGYGSDITPPEVPGGISSTEVSMSSAVISWTEPSGAPTGYTISYGTDTSAESMGMIVKGVQTTHTLTGLTDDTSYYWKVSATNGYGTGAYSSPAGFRTISKYSIIPAAPGTALVGVVDATSIQLIWTDDSYNEQNFRLEVSDNGSDYALVINPDTDETEYTDTGLDVNSRYWYRIRSENISGGSAWMDVSPVYTLANVPGVPGIDGDWDETDLYHTDIIVDANDNSVNTQYALLNGAEYLQTDGTLAPAEDWSGNLTWIHKVLAPGTTYTYSVKARNGDLIETTASGEASDRTPAEGEPSKVLLEASQANMTADGISTCELTATVQDIMGTHVADYEGGITFAVAAVSAPARLPGGTTVYAATAAGGIAIATMTATTEVGMVIVTAGFQDLTPGTTEVIVVAGSNAKIRLNSDKDVIIAGGGVSKAKISAEVLDSNDNLVPDAVNVVSFNVFIGDQARGDRQTVAVTAEAGVAEWYYLDSVAGIMTIKATSPGLEGDSIDISNMVNYGIKVESLCSEDGGKTKVVCPIYTFQDNAVVSISLMPDGEAEEYASDAWKYVPGTAREITAVDANEEDIVFTGNAKIYIPYNDVNGDGILDDLDIPVIINGVTTLRAFLFDEGNKRWVQEEGWPEPIVEENIAGFEVNHFSKYCLMVVEGDTGITDLVNYPNPLSDETVFSFILSSNVSSAVIRIYTISGRLIKSIECEGKFGYNEEAWSGGTDDDGNDLANGVYIQNS